MGKRLEDKHCGFSAAYLTCSCLRDSWTLAASFRGVWVPGLAGIQGKPSVRWSLLQARVPPLNLAGLVPARRSLTRAGLEQPASRPGVGLGVGALARLGPSWVHFCPGNSAIHVTAGAKAILRGHCPFCFHAFCPQIPLVTTRFVVHRIRNNRLREGGFCFAFSYVGQGAETVFHPFQVLKWWRFRITMETQPPLGSPC